uniref:Histone deacetylase 14 n=1 Tax=Tanacetum cinerariifolium TaxID=118510 RepID=A0A6L2M5P8_TANCI|nr:hypothetical protein [Tanacetum cinerariifolium]
MPIPGSLITAEIQKASYYQEYLENVAKHRRYLAGETGSDPDSPALKPTKPARKTKSTGPKAPPRPSISKPVTSAQPKPKSAPAKTQRKKRKPTTYIHDKPSKATKSRHGFVSKKHTPISTLKSVDESVAEDVPAKELQVDVKEANIKRALEESLKSMYDVPWSPLPPVVIREPGSGKYQPLLEVPRKGKAKGTEEQVAHDLLSLQKPKRKAMQINTYSKGAPPHLLDHPDMMNLHILSLDSQTARMNLKRLYLGLMREVKVKARLDQTLVLKMKAKLDQTLMNNLKARLDQTLQMDEGFTAMAYPKVQENLKLTVKEHMLLEEPTSSSGTLSSLQHLSKDLSFGDLFFNDKPSEAEYDKATVETEVESMVSVMI